MNICGEKGSGDCVFFPPVATQNRQSITNDTTSPHWFTEQERIGSTQLLCGIRATGGNGNDRYIDVSQRR